MRTKWFEAAEPWRWVGRALRIGLGLAIATLLWIERADAFTATVTTAAPACPVGSYGSTFGRVIVNIADQDACVGEYEVAVLRLDESVVTSTSGPPAGQVILGGISPGSYRVTVKDTTGCDTQVMTFDVTVAAGIDQVPPRLGIVRHDGAYQAAEKGSSASSLRSLTCAAYESTPPRSSRLFLAAEPF